jgi:hypothetical protein
MQTNESQENRSLIAKFWEKEYVMSNKLTLRGYSRAADRTGFMIRELKLFLDAGVGCYVIPQNCFITHSHADHCFNLPMLMVGSKSMNIYAPKECAHYIDRHIESTYCMNACSDEFEKSWYVAIHNFNAQIWYNLQSVTANDVINFTAGGRKLVSKALQMDHTVPSLGYCFSEIRTRLRQDLSYRSNAQKR